MQTRLAVIVWLAVTATIAANQNALPPAFEPVTDAQLRSDARLGRPVTSAYARIYVGDLADKLSAQTGVAIEADCVSGASDRRVMVSVRDRPAWQVMSALVGLYSYKLAVWRWERRYVGGVPEYRLVRTRGAQAFAARLAETAQSEFERVTAEAIASSRRTPEQWVARLADPSPVSVEERAGWGLQVFATALPEDVQKSVLRSDLRATIPVEQLPAWGRRLVEDLYKAMRPQVGLAGGGFAPAPFPKAIVAYTSRRDAVTPTLFLEMGDMGGYGYSGGLPLEDAFRKHVADLWIGDDDTRLNAEQEAGPCSGSPKHELDKRVHKFDEVWVGLAERTDVPLLAIAPNGRVAKSFPDDRVFTLGDYLRALARRDHAVHKWRHGILLVTHAGWYHTPEEVHACAWDEVRRLREACAANDGLPTMEALLRMASRLSAEQLEVLSDDWAPAKSLTPVRPILTAIYRDEEARTRLISDGSVSFRGPSARALASGLGHTAGDQVASVVIEAAVVREGANRHLALTVTFRDGRGNRLGGSMPRFPAQAP